MKMSNETNEVFSAFSLFQSEIKDVKRDTQGARGKYAALDQVVQLIRDILEKTGLSIAQMIGDCSNGFVVIENVVMHKSGQYFSETMRIPNGEPKGNTMIQHMGSGISYARRYGLLALAGMAQEDDDGEAPQKQNNYNNHRLPHQKLGKDIDINQRPYQHLVKDIEIIPALVKQINDLIKVHQIPTEKVDAWKSHYKIDDLSKLNETQARSIVNKVRSEMTAPLQH